MVNVMNKNRRIINNFRKPKTRCFLNDNSKIHLFTYDKTEDKDNLTWLYYGTKKKRSEVETRYRYVLGAFKEFPPHGKILICFGLNPSVGVPANLELTVKNLSGIAFSNGYKGWVMLNLFPLRNSVGISTPKATKYAFIDQLQEMERHEYKRLYRKNINYIEEILGLFPKEKVDILLAWGDSVENDKTGRLKCCIVRVYKSIKSLCGKKWIEFHIYSCYNGQGDILTKKGHPRHLKPHNGTITPVNAKLVHFDYHDYINKFCC